MPGLMDGLISTVWIMEANVQINDLSGLAFAPADLRSAFQVRTLSRTPHDSTEVQSRVGFVFRWRGGDEVRPRARTLRRNKHL